ncbi:putative Transmembrane protein [Melia azedarach]|uniref:Transmembrane protein n=1 Tax=Melia azedarach TaxID=155640 RepID=A0ACC1Z2R1_MELAZ|nr:putative Transmembrane protein [Melia azedarach]
MAGLIYEIFSSSALVSLGLYHTICTTRNHLKSSQSYSAKPYHPLPLHHHQHHRLKHLQLYLLILCLLIAFAHQTITSSDSDPLLKGRTPVHRFATLQSALVSFLFLFLSVSLLISECTSLLPFPSDLFFALGASVFYLQYSVSFAAASVQTSDLQAKCDIVSGRISALSSLLCVVLACNSKFFVADVALGGSLCLQGLWELQTGLSLYVEAFIPEGCHKLLDVVKGVEGSTKCDLEESKLRAMAILDLLFLVHVMFVFIIIMATYAVVAKTVAVRRMGSYEALPNASSDPNNHIQMKALAGTQA